MFVETVNLYEVYGVKAPESAGGELLCLHSQTPQRMNPPGMKLRRLRPAVLVLPGGGYEFISEREGEPIALRWMAKGYVAFVLKYSVAPCCFPTQLREAAMAMRYIRENCERFEVDPNMVAAIGSSAGGHLCGTLGMMYDCPEVADIGSAEMLRPNALGLNYAVSVFWGPTHDGTVVNVSGGDAELARRLSLDHLVRPDMPPVYVWHTRDDELVPSRNALILAQALNEAGVVFALHLYAHGVHGLATADVQTHQIENLNKWSAEAYGWEERMMSFFAENGFCITDRLEEE